MGPNYPNYTVNKWKQIGLSVLLICVFSCKDVSTEKDQETGSVASKQTPVVAVQTDFTNDTLFTVAFPRDSSSVTITGRLDGINKPVTAMIPVTKGSELSASVVPADATANIRINQVLMPNGKADGPFGRAVRLKISGEGIYKLVIGENLMQGEEWKGGFTLSISVK